MPSPFPGMDPYLEDPARWPGIRHELISATKERLNAQLAPRYVARVELRLYNSRDADLGRVAIEPDLGVNDVRRKRHPPAGSVEVDSVKPIVVVTMTDEEIREPYITVRDVARRSVVTIIEFVSPTNKTPGAVGWKRYEEQRAGVIRSDRHWVEIDLLRQGSTLDVRRRLRPHHYIVHVSKAQSRPEGVLWPIRLDQRLPVISIPLNADDPDATLDLQDVLTTTYDRSSCEFEIDYTTDPTPPLDPEFHRWADRHLKEKGLR